MTCYEIEQTYWHPDRMKNYSKTDDDTEEIKDNSTQNKF